MKPTVYNSTLPTSAEYWLRDLGAKRPTTEVLHIIATSGFRAFEFAIDIAAIRELDLEFIGAENLV